MKSLMAQFCLIVLCWGYCTSDITLAQESTLPTPGLSNTTSPKLDFTDGVIVLQDGRVFSGRISNVAGGYRVDSNGTYGIVPFTKVDVTARSLSEAYTALRDRTLKPRVQDHLVLAEWCLTNGLVGQARTEVSKALKLEPLRPESRALMVKIEEKLNPAKKPTELPKGPAMTLDGFLRTEERTSAGLSRELHQTYIRRIQPLVLNKCGNAYCHGQAAKNEFRLTAIRKGSLGNKLQSQSNLDNVLQQIDLRTPERSPFLTKAIAVDSHHQKIFLGPRGNDQHQVLKDWVSNAARELAGSASSSSLAKVRKPDQQPLIQQAGAEMEAERSPTSNPRRDSIHLKDILKQSHPDPFDPDVFNRRVHGGTAKELREGKAIKQPEAQSQEVTPLEVIVP